MSEYTDIKNNTYEILQKTLSTDAERECMEEEVVEELYKIFTHQ